MSPEDIKSAKLASKCALCGRRGHWTAAHLPEGSIKDNLPSLPPDNNDTNQAGGQAGQAKAEKKDQGEMGGAARAMVAFILSLHGPSMQAASLSASNTNGPTRGSLLDDGPLLRAIGGTEFRMLTGVAPVSSDAVQKIPDAIKGYEWWQYGHGQHSSEQPKTLGAIATT